MNMVSWAPGFGPRSKSQAAQQLLGSRTPGSLVVVQLKRTSPVPTPGAGVANLAAMMAAVLPPVLKWHTLRTSSDPLNGPMDNIPVGNWYNDEPTSMVHSVVKGILCS